MNEMRLSVHLQNYEDKSAMHTVMHSKRFTNKELSNDLNLACTSLPVRCQIRVSNTYYLLEEGPKFCAPSSLFHPHWIGTSFWPGLPSKRCLVRRQFHFGFEIDH